MKDIHGPRRIRVVHETHGDQTDGDTPNVEPPTIHFTRTLPGGRTMTYDGTIVVEGNPSRAEGTYVINGSMLSLDAEEGEWTANRPPPRPVKNGKRTGTYGKSRTGGKGASAKKSKSGKNVAVVKGGSASNKSVGGKKPSRGLKAASKKEGATPSKKARTRR
jgi:hypothetical protein